jgi:hypothetical protein
MKTISKIFGLALVLGLSLSFASCGSDDEGPAAVPVDATIDFPYQIALRGIADQNSGYTTTPLTVYLKDAIGEERADNFVINSARDKYSRGDMYLEVTGITDLATPVVLKDFTIKIAGKETKLGDCSLTGTFKPDYQWKSDTYTEVCKNLYEAVTSGSKKAEVYVSYTPSADIATDDKVYLVLKVHGDYQYNTYPTAK